MLQFKRLISALSGAGRLGSRGCPGGRLVDGVGGARGNAPGSDQPVVSGRSGAARAWPSLRPLPPPGPALEEMDGRHVAS